MALEPRKKTRPNFLDVPGEMAKRIYEHDWSKTSLGPIETWDTSLKVAVGIILRSPFPKFIAVGPEFILIYNDAYIPVTGSANHPHALGSRYQDVRAEVWHEVKALFNKVEHGQSHYSQDQKFLLDRNGRTEEAYFTFSLSPLIDANGKIQSILCTCVETTNTVQAMSAEKQARSELAYVLESMDEAFFAVDKNWIVIAVNEHQEKLSHRKREDQVGKNFLELFFANARERESKYWRYFHQVMNERIHISFEDCYEPLQLWTAVNAFPKEDGGMVVFFRDINSEKKREQELTKAKEEAERANHLKSAFLANMSHEIRTPLGAMMGFADLLNEPGISEAERANYVQILHRNGEQLGRVINDILDLSKVETGHISFEYMRVNPLQVAHEVVSLMSVIAREKNLLLSFSDDGSTPREIVTDPTRMKQVLMNLVSNALKFTKVGSIKITLSGYEGPQGEKCCAFRVMDTGAGIPEESVEKLFRMFTQADNSMTRKYGGTGLGLALSRSLARGMGGDVQLEKTARNKGSTFSFSLQSRDDLLPKLSNENITLSNQGAAPPENALENLRILLVEDSADNQHLIWRYLSKYGAYVEIADNGLEGMTKAMAGDHDIVLMDLQMPVMDGYTAVGNLRARGYRKPIIALTAHAMSDVRKKCQDVGCNDHLPKPINVHELVSTVFRHTH